MPVGRPRVEISKAEHTQYEKWRTQGAADGYKFRQQQTSSCSSVEALAWLAGCAAPDTELADSITRCLDDRHYWATIAAALGYGDKIQGIRRAQHLHKTHSSKKD